MRMEPSCPTANPMRSPRRLQGEAQAALHLLRCREEGSAKVPKPHCLILGSILVPPGQSLVPLVPSWQHGCALWLPRCRQRSAFQFRVCFLLRGWSRVSGIQMAPTAAERATNPAPATCLQGPREGPTWGHRERWGLCPGVAVALCPWGHGGHLMDLVALPASTGKLMLPDLAWLGMGLSQGVAARAGIHLSPGPPGGVPVTPWIPWGHLSLHPADAWGARGHSAPPWVLFLGAVGDVPPSPAPPRRGVAAAAPGNRAENMFHK